MIAMWCDVDDVNWNLNIFSCSAVFKALSIIFFGLFFFFRHLSILFPCFEFNLFNVKEKTPFYLLWCNSKCARECTYVYRTIATADFYTDHSIRLCAYVHKIFIYINTAHYQHYVLVATNFCYYGWRKRKKSHTASTIAFCHSFEWEKKTGTC